MKNLFLACSIPILAGCAAIIPTLKSGAVALAAKASAAPVAAAAASAGVGLGIGVIAGEDFRRLAQETQDAEFGPQRAGTYGAFLKDSQTAVQSLVLGAAQSQREVLVVAGLQAQGTIVRAAAAYRDKLSLNLDRLGEPEKKFKTDLESVLADLKADVELTQKNAGDRAQRLTASLQVTTGAPHLTSLGPIFLFSHLPSQRVTARGRFPESYARSSVPEISIEGKSYKAFDYWPDSLRFSIPKAAFGEGEPQEIVWKKAELIVPWVSPQWNVASGAEPAKFGVVIGLLPHSFGNMNIQYKTTRLRQEETNKLSDDFLFDASERDVEENRCLTLTPEEFADGWRIKPGSSTFVPTQVKDAQNAAWKDLGVQSENERSVCRRSLAIHRDAGAAESGGGKMLWKIAVRLQREVSDPIVVEENRYLDWGTKHTFKYAPGTWRLRYARNGGSARELDAADSSNPLIRVNADASSVTISIYPF
ncbi:MAG: hypothetical protein ACKVQK_03600 [Burkholderiales bacterium]